MHKSLKSKRVGGPKIKRYSTKTRSTHSFTMERAVIRIVRSTVSPALFYNGRHTLLILPFVLLVELGCLTVGWTVGVWFIKQRLRKKKERFSTSIAMTAPGSFCNCLSDFCNHQNSGQSLTLGINPIHYAGLYLINSITIKKIFNCEWIR